MPGHGHREVRGKNAEQAGHYPERLVQDVVRALCRRQYCDAVEEEFTGPKEDELRVAEQQAYPRPPAPPKVSKPLVGPTKAEWEAHNTLHVPYRA